MQKITDEQLDRQRIKTLESRLAAAKKARMRASLLCDTSPSVNLRRQFAHLESQRLGIAFQLSAKIDALKRSLPPLHTDIRLIPTHVLGRAKRHVEPDYV